MIQVVLISMLSTHLLALMLALAPSLASAGLFPPDSVVKMLDPKSFKKAMRANVRDFVTVIRGFCLNILLCLV